MPEMEPAGHDNGGWLILVASCLPDKPPNPAGVHSLVSTLDIAKRTVQGEVDYFHGPALKWRQIGDFIGEEATSPWGTVWTLWPVWPGDLPEESLPDA